MAMPKEPNDERQLQPVQPQSPAEPSLFTDERITLIRNTVAKDAPEDVFRAMIDIAKVRNLDPMAKQIGVAKFDRNGPWTVYTPIDGYRAIAGDHPDFAGKDAPVFGPAMGTTPQGKSSPEWCSVTVYRLVGGQRMPFTETVYWEEYYGGEKNFSWNKMPRTMLAKVAESHALRQAFTRSLSGIYTQEEMDQASVEVQGRVVDRSTGEISSHETAMKRLHAVARKAGIDHDALHQWAVRAGTDSLNDATAAWLTTTANRIEENPEAAREYARVSMEQRQQASYIDAEGKSVDDAGDMEAAMDDAANRGTPTNGADEPA